MTAKEVLSYLRSIQRRDKHAMDIQVTFEHKKDWKGYHMSPGCSRRGQRGKPDQIVFRLET